MALTIRLLEARDRAEWQPLWEGYLKFYEHDLGKEITDHTWQMLRAQRAHVALVAEADGRLVGLAHYLIHSSTWSIRGYCYLEDLFVAPDARMKGVGRALLDAVYAAAKREGCTRIYWMTHKDNARARPLYDRVAKPSDFIQYRSALSDQ